MSNRAYKEPCQLESGRPSPIRQQGGESGKPRPRRGREAMAALDSRWNELQVNAKPHHEAQLQRPPGTPTMPRASRLLMRPSLPHTNARPSRQAAAIPKAVLDKCVRLTPSPAKRRKNPAARSKAKASRFMGPGQPVRHGQRVSPFDRRGLSPKQHPAPAPDQSIHAIGATPDRQAASPSRWMPWSSARRSPRPRPRAGHLPFAAFNGLHVRRQK